MHKVTLFALIIASACLFACSGDEKQETKIAKDVPHQTTTPKSTDPDTTQAVGMKEAAAMIEKSATDAVKTVAKQVTEKTAVTSEAVSRQVENITDVTRKEVTQASNTMADMLSNKVTDTKTAASAPSLPIKMGSTSGDPVQGANIAKKCAACHNFTDKHKVGPGLAGIVGRTAGTSGFAKHSAALNSADWIWDETRLKKWICDSSSAIKEFTGDNTARTKMPKQKICGTKADDVVAYLKTI